MTKFINYIFPFIVFHMPGCFDQKCDVHIHIYLDDNKNTGTAKIGAEHR